VEPSDVGHAVFGNVIHTEVRDMYLGRVAALNGGLPVETPAFTVNRLCGSGLQAIGSAAQAIQLGDAETAVAGGAESMSRGQYWLRHALGPADARRRHDRRYGWRADRSLRRLPHGVTAETVAAEFGVSRADQDALAVESHQRAAAAAAAGYFAEQIMPVEVRTKEGHRGGHRG